MHKKKEGNLICMIIPTILVLSIVKIKSSSVLMSAAPADVPQWAISNEKIGKKKQLPTLCQPRMRTVTDCD